jgi:hypothetical protein
MTVTEKNLTKKELVEAKSRRLVAMHLQDIESNPLDAEDKAMFEMFEREGWSHDRRLAYIRERARSEPMAPAAE